MCSLVDFVVKTIDIAPITLQVSLSLYLQLFSFHLIFSIYGSHEKTVTGELEHVFYYLAVVSDAV